MCDNGSVVNRQCLKSEQKLLDFGKKILSEISNYNLGTKRLDHLINKINKIYDPLNNKTTKLSGVS